MLKTKNESCRHCSQAITSRDDLVVTTFEAKRVVYCKSCYSELLKQNEVVPYTPSKLNTFLNISIRVVLFLFLFNFAPFEIVLLSIFLFYVEFTNSIGKIQNAIYRIKAAKVHKHHNKYGHYNAKLHHVDNRSTIEKAIYYRSTDAVSELEGTMDGEQIMPSLSFFNLTTIEIKSFFTSGIFDTKIFTNTLFVTLYFLVFSVYLYLLAYVGSIYLVKY